MARDKNRENNNEESKKEKRRNPGRLRLEAMAAFLALVLFVLGIFIFGPKITGEGQKEPEPAETETPAPLETEAPPAPTSHVIEYDSEEDEDYVYEDTSEIPEAVYVPEEGSSAVEEEELPLRYDNSVSLSCNAGRGTKVTIGLGRNIEGDGIYLNPSIVDPNELMKDEKYAFLCSASFGSISTTGTPSDKNSSANAGNKYFYLAGRTYDKLVPAGYVSNDSYGVCWYDATQDGQYAGNSADIYIQAIRLSDGVLMDGLKARVEYVETEKTYKLVSLTRSDVLVTGDLDGATRDGLIRGAIAFLNEGNKKLDVTITDDDYFNVRNNIVVEKRMRFCYGRIFDAVGVVRSAGEMSHFTEIYAVHIPHFGYGYFTVYIAELHDVSTYSHVPISDEAADGYAVIGYDALAPFTVDVFNSHLLPDDREAFGVS